MIRRTVLIAGMIGIARLPLAAQQPAPDSTRLPVVRVLGGSVSTVERVPGSIGFIDAVTLRQSMVLTSHEALRKVPGVVARDEEGLGLRPNFGIRGLNPVRSTKTLLLEDGVPFSIAPYGDNASYYHPPVDRFDRIEVLKGSGQIMYGPHTIGGIINYLTPDIPPNGRRSFSVVGGTRDLMNARGEFASRWGGTGASLQLMHKQADGARDNVGSRLNDATLRATFELGREQSLVLKANVYRERSRVTYSGLTEAEWATDPFQNAFHNDSMLLDRWGLTAAHRARIGGSLDLSSTAYSYAIERDWWRQSSNSAQRPNDRSDPACGGMDNLDSGCGIEGRLRNYRVMGFEPRASIAHLVGSLAGRLDAGVRVHAERQDRRQVNAPSPMARASVEGDPGGGLREQNERSVDALSGFVQYRLMGARASVTPGIRVERVHIARTNSLGASPVSGDGTITEVIPGLGATFELAPGAIAFVGAHRGFSPPRPEDLIDNASGAVTELEAERSWNYELGLRVAPLSGFNFEVAAFRLDFSNQIVPQSVAGGAGAALTSAGRTLHQGIEIGGRLSPSTWLGWQNELFVELAAAFLPVARFEGERYAFLGVGGGDVPDKVYPDQNAAGTRTRVPVTGNRLPYAPERTLTATVGVTLRGDFHLRTEVVHIGQQFGDALNTRVLVSDGQQGPIPAATIVNLAAGHSLPMQGSRILLSVKNLFDRTYLVDRTRGLLPGTPRLVQVGVEVSK